MISRKNLGRISLIVIFAYVLSCFVFYFVGGDQIHNARVKTGDMVDATNEFGELTAAREIKQPFKVDADFLQSVTLMGYDYNRVNRGTIEVSIWDTDTLLGSKNIPMELIVDRKLFDVEFDQPVDIKDKDNLFLKIKAVDTQSGSSGTFYFGSSISLLRGTQEKVLQESEKAVIDGKAVEGVLCFVANAERSIWFGEYFWYFAIVGFLIIVGYSRLLLRDYEKDRKMKGLAYIETVVKYRFLIQQLVERDFKTKYKRSILGVLWSFLNPLMTMAVQYVVFSTIFKSNIENFAVYLLSGIVCFNFFSEVTNMSLTSIVGNASLITKVYIPKVIYPMSRAFSSTINFLLSIIPLLVVMIVTKTPITVATLLLPFGIICLFALCLGVGLILSSLMVFFRDTQFLWGVFSMIWMYMTPIFYPESIITGWLLTLMKLNPLYHVIRFFRIILLEGVSPEPKAFLLCFVASAIPLILGITVFKKTQDRFVLYI